MRGAHAAAATKREKRARAEAFAAELRGERMVRRREAKYRAWERPAWSPRREPDRTNDANVLTPSEAPVSYAQARPTVKSQDVV